ncbi:Sodium/hydrogen exchanger family-domain-containing protein [Hyaloraphidium curvatum]|nr:Sodium/hydrogen exchanger family-domain-containing protein [Hyaloraphidium curvatum]
MPRLRAFGPGSQLGARYDAALNGTAPTPDEVETFEAGMALAGMIAIACTVVGMSISVFTWRARWLFLPDTTICVLIGLAVGAAVNYGSGGALEFAVVLNSTFFFYVILPPIMFEAGYSVNRPRFRKNLVFILTTASLGVVISSFVAAAIMYACSMAYHQGGFESFLESLTFSSVLAATDPVSVLATFQAVPCHPDLDTLIFGEAALNDAVAIIMYQLTSQLLEPGSEIGAGTVGRAIGRALAIFFGALGVGLLFGVVVALALRWIPYRQRGSVNETALVLGLAYCSYIFSDYFALSGIITVLAMGMFCAEIVVPSLSPEAERTVEKVLRVLSLFLENMLFVYLGFGILGTSDQDRTYDAAVIAYSVCAILVGRIASIVLLVPLCNLTKVRKEDRFGWRGILFLIYAGLRGGIAFVLSLELGENAYLPLAYRQLCVGTTLVIIFISVVFVGGGTERVMKVLEVEHRPGAELNGSLDHDGTPPKDEEEAPVDRGATDALEPPESKYAKFKRKVLAPIMIRPPSPRPEPEPEPPQPARAPTGGTLASLGAAGSAGSLSLRRGVRAEKLHPETVGDWAALREGNADAKGSMGR